MTNRIVTPRLELIEAALEIVSADLHQRDKLGRLLDATLGPAWPPPLVDVAAMQRIKESLIENPSPAGWTTYYVVTQEPRVVIGICGFKSSPKEGIVELGYSIVPAYQARGLGTEIVKGLTHWAFEHDEVSCVFAETLPELHASQRVLEKNGFTLAATASEPDVIRFERLRRPAH